MATKAAWLDGLGLAVPIFQAPMAGVSNPRLAAAVCNAGALGALGLGASSVEAARNDIHALRALTNRAFHLNFFCHAPAVSDAAVNARWLAWLAPEFARFGAEAPRELREIYPSFGTHEAMVALVLDERPAVVSFHFGLPSREVIAQLQRRGTIVLATATSLAEGRQVEAAGCDGVIAQGVEAGGHRGVFDPSAPDGGLGVLALTRLLVRALRIPVVAAGGIMDGAGIAAALALGAVAAQLGTAFVACPESSADDAYRAALQGPNAEYTLFTSVISGRVARGMPNDFTARGLRADRPPTPAYPIAYDAGKALHAAAKARGNTGFAAQWAGQGAPLARALPAAELVRTLAAELAVAKDSTAE